MAWFLYLKTYLMKRPSQVLTPSVHAWDRSNRSRTPILKKDKPLKPLFLHPSLSTYHIWYQWMRVFFENFWSAVMCLFVCFAVIVVLWCQKGRLDRIKPSRSKLASWESGCLANFVQRPASVLLLWYSSRGSSCMASVPFFFSAMAVYHTLLSPLVIFHRGIMLLCDSILDILCYSLSSCSID